MNATTNTNTTATVTTTAPVCTRDDYGMIRTAPADLSTRAADLVARAVRNGSIPARFDNISFSVKSGRSKAEGRALHHEVYDITPDGRSCMICVRETEGSKHGVSTIRKTYFVLSRWGRGVRTTEVSKHLAAKAAKRSRTALGQAIAEMTMKAAA